MEHLILTETEFFRLIDNLGSRTGLKAAYNEFTMAVVSLCTGAASPCHPLPALSYAETELQYHKALQDTDTDHGVYARKALAFVRRMLKHLAMPHNQMPPLSSVPAACPGGGKAEEEPVLRWTGNKLKDKQCYNAYADIKRRKNDSRTYFLDKVAEKLNRRMQEDEERERMRKR